MLIRAAHVVPVVGRPIADAAVRVQDGLIAAVGSARELPPIGDEPVENLGSAVLIPGLVNAHAHLELTALGGHIPAGLRFAEWVRRLIALRAATPTETRLSAARLGARQLLQSGTTTVADIVSVDAIDAALADLPLRRIVLWELLGIGPRQAAGLERLAKLTEPGSPMSEPSRGPAFGYGLAPHAVYSTGVELLRAAGQSAQRLGRPLTLHLAETSEETEFATLGSGPLRTLLGELSADLPGADWTAPGLPPVELAESLGLLGPGTLAAHVSVPGAADAARLARTGTSVVWCPGSHEYFGRGRHPFRDLADAGVNVCLGTDSSASLPHGEPLSVLAEMRRVWQSNRSLLPGLILRMATLNGAAALGLAESLGALAVGYRADVVAVPLTRPGPSDPLENVLAGSASPSRVYRDGKLVFADSSAPGAPQL